MSLWNDYFGDDGSSTYRNDGDGDGGSSGFGTVASLASGIGSGSDHSSDGGGTGWLDATKGAICDMIGGWKASDYLDLARLGMGWKMYSDSKHPPKFTNIPLSPEQQKLWDLFYAQQTDPKTQHNAAQVSDYARGMLDQLHPTWTPPATSKGETGYNGTAGFKFPQFDWNGYGSTPGAGGAGSPTGGPAPAGTQVGAGEGSGPNDNAGDAFGHETSPAGSEGDPFSNLPSINGKPIDVSGVTSADMRAFVKQYGKAGVEIVMGILTSNPSVTLKGALDVGRSWMAGNSAQNPPGTPTTLPTKTPNVPNLTPGKGSTPTPGPAPDYKPPTIGDEIVENGKNFIRGQQNSLINGGPPGGPNDPTGAGGVSVVLNRRERNGGGGRK